jgi:uncharacterized BrkB/YihY/UPF0761 family membrane protein
MATTTMRHYRNDVTQHLVEWEAHAMHTRSQLTAVERAICVFIGMALAFLIIALVLIFLTTGPAAAHDHARPELNGWWGKVVVGLLCIIVMLTWLGA